MFFYPVMIVSIPFLIITFCIYGCVKELRNLHGKCFMSYIFSLLTMYSLLVTVQMISTYDLAQNHPIICKTIGYGTLVSIFTCFFWLNVMCFDIWMTFRKGMRNEHTEKIYLKYCVYAFGVPILIVITAFLLNNYNIISKAYRSEIGDVGCMVGDNKTSQLIYIYVPIMIFLTVNTFLYVITAFKIYRVQKETLICKKGTESSRHSKTNIEKTR